MSDSDDCPPGSSEKKSRRRDYISPFNRRHFIKIMLENGSSYEACGDILDKCRRIGENKLSDFFNKRARKAQEKVGEEVNTTEFALLEEWINCFQEKGFDADCGFELPVVLKAIAATEAFPKAESNDDIQFEKLYLWLAEVMCGNAPPALNSQSQLFLMDNFKNLVEATRTPESEADLLRILTSLRNKSSIDIDTKSNFSKSIDQLELNKLNLKNEDNVNLKIEH